ncbi:hypothetical protein H7H82_17915 [Mycobacterium heidelbergense]|uniref:hypothetical protein n=1 Tax=Mycobacterium heidelbergense TaxID=53376 RepID=UPI00114D8DB0|nr:hypothetical protein [Mycobacterium heidelbergense]MCV7052446.1 hypothetical protein [Mycobacterium heidelbergense]BBZ50434.1 hypothetical protein MHEI_21510 [Mycobacterium heidelbergense]
MDLAARPHITAGVALASAAVLAAGPIAQHLPGLHTAQQLRQLSVSDIQLADASSALDLFSGVENELAALASGATAAALPADVLGGLLSPITQNLVVQTWMNTFASAGTNLQTVYNTWSEVPFPVLQQVAANGVSYADLYVSQFQTAATSAIKFFMGTQKSQFAGLINTALADFMSGQISTAFYPYLYEALWSFPFTQVLLPMRKILNIPIDISQNLYNATNYLLTTGVTDIGNFGILQLPHVLFASLGNNLQLVYDSWTAGNPLGALTNLANMPGAITNDFLNGGVLSGRSLTSGLLNYPSGTLSVLVNTIAGNLATEIVAPNAQNVALGGSLANAIQGFVNQLINGWPSLTAVVNAVSSGLSNIPGELTSLLRSIPPVLSSLPSVLGNIATQVGTLLMQLLKLL